MCIKLTCTFLNFTQMKFKNVNDLTCQLRDNHRIHQLYYIFTEGDRKKKSRLIHLAVKIDFSNVKIINCLIIILVSKA